MPQPRNKVQIKSGIITIDLGRFQVGRENVPATLRVDTTKLPFMIARAHERGGKTSVCQDAFEVIVGSDQSA